MKNIISVVLLLVATNVMAVDLSSYASHLICQDNQGKALKVGLNPIKNEAYIFFQDGPDAQVVERHLGGAGSVTSVTIESVTNTENVKERKLSINVASMSLSTYAGAGFEVHANVLEDNSISWLQMFFAPLSDKEDDEPVIRLPFGALHCTFTE